MASLYFTPAEVGNSKAKVIERYFGHLNKKRAQKTKFWTGFNVDAKKTNQVNKEYLDLIKNQAPDRAGLVKQIDRMVEMERAAGESDLAGIDNARAVLGRAVIRLETYLIEIGISEKPSGEGSDAC